MSRRHAAGLLLALCCVLGSPGLATAAAPNQLRDGSVSPGTGTTQTAFAFAVTYSSERNFAATSVAAKVAGRSMALSLASGTSTAGTYRGTASLPAGSWPVTFEAQATQGPIAILPGPTVVVSAPVQATPKPVPATPTPTPKPVAPPAPTPGPAVATPPPAPRPPATPTSQPAHTDPTALSVPASMTPTDQPETPRPAGSASPADRAKESPSAASVASPASSTAPEITVPGSLSPAAGAGDPDGTPPWPLLIGSATAAFLLLMAWRRRFHGGDQGVDVGAGADGEPISLMTRAGRPANTGAQAEDPILAAMGVGAQAPRPPELDVPLSRRVRSGPGERIEPVKSRRAG